MKNIFIAMVITMLLLFTSSTVYADRTANVLIGIGAIAVGSVLLHDNYQPYNHNPRHEYNYRQNDFRPRIAPRSVWMPPTRIKVWTPGHYSQYGIWVRGGWRTETIIPDHYRYRDTPDNFELHFRYYR